MAAAQPIAERIQEENEWTIWATDAINTAYGVIVDGNPPVDKTREQVISELDQAKHLLAIRLRESGLNNESKLGQDLLDKNKKIVEELEKRGELDNPVAFGGRRRKSRRNKSRIRR